MVPLGPSWMTVRCRERSPLARTRSPEAASAPVGVVLAVRPRQVVGPRPLLAVLAELDPDFPSSPRSGLHQAASIASRLGGASRRCQSSAKDRCLDRLASYRMPVPSPKIPSTRKGSPRENLSSPPRGKRELGVARRDRASAFALCTPAAEPLSRYVPEEGLAGLVEFDGLDAHSAAWKKSAAYKILTETKMGSMLETCSPRACRPPRRTSRLALLPSPGNLELTKYG